ncbi:Polyketide cyclase/dehydrase [Arabidopsis thaliana x Arabidopsis arenosa]|uniref:Polyketide cyclase/dehydrase n=1 Tax=Arabidopsis thaliana x Arabidopsis arenosa TaxID=1240361 RepID=A0A8T2AC17_9BRAS|nr:Polyketide cyclase/dehydrase [Arabidopsis thaliana x Arabidopsis arenosa]
MPTAIQFQRSSTAAEAANATVNNYTHHKQVQKVSLTRGMADVPDHVELAHTHVVGPSQCFSVMVQDVEAPASAVWSILSRFEHPQAYKHFVKSCHVAIGDGREIGSVREVRVVSGLPAAFSLERLEIMDDDRHVISFSVVGGDHRLMNYKSVTTVHESESSDDGKKRTLVVESYVVDVPAGNDKEETCSFADTIVRCNLQSLAKLAENTSKFS